MGSRHAILGPSGSERWIACTRAPRLEQLVPNEETVYAREGTLAHELAALVLEVRAGVFKSKYPNHYNDLMEHWQRDIVAFYTEIGDANPWAAYLAMLEYAEEWALYVQEVYQLHYASQIFVEREYDLSAYVPESFGTGDAMVLLPGELHAFDYKFGAGKQVYAANNSQVMCYALGALIEFLSDSYQPTYVVLHIGQPRSGGYSHWRISVDELFEWADFVLAPAAAKAWKGEGDFKPGPHCQFCRAQLICSARMDEFYTAMEAMDAGRMTPEEQALVLERGEAIMLWIKKMREKATADIRLGREVPGFKLVEGSGRREFKNEDDVVDALFGEDIELFNSKLRPLTEIEKELGPKKFAQLLGDAVIKRAGADTLVPLSDKRKAINFTGAEVYDDIDPDYEDLT